MDGYRVPSVSVMTQQNNKQQYMFFSSSSSFFCSCVIWKLNLLQILFYFSFYMMPVVQYIYYEMMIS